jgi:hypothetical protein
VRSTLKRSEKKVCLEKVKVVKYEKDGEQHVENHADKNDKVEKLSIPTLLAWFVFYRFIHGALSALYHPSTLKNLSRLPLESQAFSVLRISCLV